MDIKKRLALLTGLASSTKSRDQEQGDPQKGKPEQQGPDVRTELERLLGSGRRRRDHLGAGSEAPEPAPGPASGTNRRAERGKFVDPRLTGNNSLADPRLSGTDQCQGSRRERSARSSTRPADPKAAAAAVEGEVEQLHSATIVTVDRMFSPPVRWGDQQLPSEPPPANARLLRGLSREGHAQVVEEEPGPRTPSLIFLDAETTGLARGTGTIPFLVGTGRFRNGGFQVRQRFLPSPADEEGFLQALAEDLGKPGVLVTYNGKSFDVVLLRTRFKLHGLDDPFIGCRHLDLLHVSRSLRGHRLPDCRLATMEEEVLGLVRHDDLPGAQVPEVYFDFVQDGVTEKLGQVVEHNRLDIVSLAALLEQLEGSLDPGCCPRGDDRAAAARLLDRSGDREGAIAAAVAAAGEVSDATHEQERLWLTAAGILKRWDRRREAVEIWHRLASHSSSLAALEELAKHHEHCTKDLERALTHALRALELLDGDPGTGDVEHRIARLRRKIERRAGEDGKTGVGPA